MRTLDDDSCLPRGASVTFACIPCNCRVNLITSIIEHVNFSSEVTNSRPVEICVCVICFVLGAPTYKNSHTPNSSKISRKCSNGQQSDEMSDVKFGAIRKVK